MLEKERTYRHWFNRPALREQIERRQVVRFRSRARGVSDVELVLEKLHHMIAALIDWRVAVHRPALEDRVNIAAHPLVIDAIGQIHAIARHEPDAMLADRPGFAEEDAPSRCGLNGQHIIDCRPEDAVLRI